MYRTILIDPPWNYDMAGKRHVGRSPRKQAQDHYRTMTLPEITALPVEEVSDTNAHLYLWTTNAFIHEACHLIDAWGFRQISMITWVKDRMGTGWYFRGQTEHMLFSVCGSLPIPPELRGVTFFTGGVGRHSEKPEEGFELIERASPAPRLELFARRTRDGWDTWGDELSSPVQLPGFPERRQQDLDDNEEEED